MTEITTVKDLRVRIDDQMKVISVCGPVIRLEKLLDGIAREERCDPQHKAVVDAMLVYENSGYADGRTFRAVPREVNYGGSRIDVTTNYSLSFPADDVVTDKSVVLHYRANLGTFESKKELFGRVVGQMAEF